MSSERPRLELRFTDADWELPPWPLVSEIAKLLPARSWTLVGGLMVQTHAWIRSFAPARTTEDVDTVLHLETGAITFNTVAGILRGAGFELLDTTFAYRFVRDRRERRDIVDVMCSDGELERVTPKYRGKSLFGVPGASTALRETIDVDITVPGGDTVTLSMPSVRGAMVLKGAAYLEDSRGRERHASDGVMLLACVEEPLAMRTGMGSRSRRHIRALLRGVERHREAWLEHDRIVQDLAREHLTILRSQFDVDGVDNSAGAAGANLR